MRASRLIAVVIFPGLIATGSGSARRRRRRPARPPALRPTGRVQTVAAKIAKLPAANWSEIVSGHTADCSLHWVVVSSGDASDSPGQVLFFDRKSLIGTPTPDPTDIAAVQYMASGPRAGVLPNGHGHGPVQNRRRQARGARSHSQPIATRRARCHRRSRTQRR